MRSHHLFFVVNVSVFASWRVLTTVNQARCHSSINMLLFGVLMEEKLWEAERGKDSPSGPAQTSKARSIPVFLSRSLTLCCMTACWSALTQLTFLAHASCSGCSEKAKPCKTECAALLFSVTSEQRQPLRTQLQALRWKESLFPLRTLCNAVLSWKSCITKECTISV